jgi:putative ABC transport system permease protein
MSFLSLILKNLLRQRVRTSLTALGIAVGITTVVALSVITGSARSTTEDILRAGGADFLVGQQGAADLTFSTVSEEDWRAIESRPDIQWAHGSLLHVSRVGSNPYFVTVGVEPGDLAESPPAAVSGALLTGATDEIVLGERAAEDLGVGIGGTVTIDRVPLRVTGLYRTGNVWQDNGAYALLATVQQIARKPGVVTGVYVKVRSGADPDTVAAAIRREFPQLTTVSGLDEVGEIDQGIRIIDALNLAVSLLAVGIGAIGVMNTMVMSVFERTREIGILRAVGWSGRRILTMVLGESLLLCLLAAVAGVGLGIAATRGVALIPEVRSFLQLEYTAEPFVKALAVAAIVALLGAAYPALRAVRLTPMEALRHE